MRRGGALRHPNRSAPRLGSRFAVGTGHLCQIKFWLMQFTRRGGGSDSQELARPSTTSNPAVNFEDDHAQCVRASFPAVTASLSLFSDPLSRRHGAAHLKRAWVNASSLSFYVGTRARAQCDSAQLINRIARHPGPMPRRARPRWQRFHQLADETVNGLDGFRYGHFVDEFTPPLARIF